MADHVEMRHEHPKLLKATLTEGNHNATPLSQHKFILCAEYRFGSDDKIAKLAENGKLLMALGVNSKSWRPTFMRLCLGH